MFFFRNPSPSKNPLFQNVTWPSVSSTHFRYLDIDNNLVIRLNPREETYRKWVALYNKFGIPPHFTY